MNKTFKVALHEYKGHVQKKSFWIALLSIPLGISLVMFLSIYMAISSVNTDPVGYVDEANLIGKPQVIKEKSFLSDPQIPLIPFADEASAEEAAKADEIQAFFVIPEQFRSTYRLTYYFNEPVSDYIISEINALMRDNLLSGESIPNLERISARNRITLQSLDGTTTAQENDWGKVVIPLIIGMMFFMVLIFSGSYLLQAVVDEKENRTMEVMITSVSPSQLMAGKIIGNISVGLTQILAWVLLAGIALIVFRSRLPFLQDLQISWPFLLVSIALLLPAFVTTSALMATLGATVTDTQEAQSVTGLITLPTLLPYYVLTPIMMNPNGTVARALSYFPLSAPVAMSLRMAFGKVPTAEIILVFVIIVAFAVLSVWLAGKAFRMGMLQYSKRIPLRQLFQKEANHE